MRNKKNAKPYKHQMISSEVERIVSEVVSYEIKDKRVMGNAIVTGISLSKDYSHLKVYVHIETEDKDEVLEGLKSASGFVRHVIAEQLDLRKTPEVVFKYDDSIDKMKRMEELFKTI